MKIVVAPVTFKGSLTSLEATECIAKATREVLSGSEVIEFPLSDGGEGFVDVFVRGTSGKYIDTEVDGPLPQQRVQARWGILGDNTTAVIEMAAAAGLSLVPMERRNPKITTTFGVGQLIKAALDRGVKKIILGIGGSATNDGGAGMAQALGVRLLKKDGTEVERGGAALRFLHQIDLSWRDRRIRQTHFIAASDVTNPLSGPRGASAVYGPQKGATPEDVELLDKALAHYGALIKRDVGIDVMGMAGAGAAGGLGAGCAAFLNAKIQLGIEFLLEELRFDGKLRGADLLITGEGKIDRQTMFGKAISGVVQRASTMEIPAVAICGTVDGDPRDLKEALGLKGLYSISGREISVRAAMGQARELLSQRTKEVLSQLVRSGFFKSKYKVI